MREPPLERGRLAFHLPHGPHGGIIGVVPPRRTACLAALVLTAGAFCAPAHATDYWVAPSGSNANDGLSLAFAWATLVFASEQVGPGDTVHVEPGSYQGFYLETSGTAADSIAFVAAGPGVTIVADNPVTPDGINIEGAGHVVVDGFTVTNRTRAGIRAASSNFVTIRNCTTGDNGRWGIFTGFTDDLTIEFNETYGSVLEHGIYVSNSCDRPIVRGNLVHDNHANGIHLNGDLSQGGDGLIEQALIENNVIYGNGAGGGSGINGDGLVDSVIRNNLLFDNHASGISLYRIDGGTGATDNLVANNTILNASDARWCVNINNGSTGNTVVNNILYNEHSFRGVISVDASSRSGFSSDYNSVMNRFSVDGGDSVIGLAAWQAQGYDANSFVALPADLFIVPGSDFHLSAASPAVDAGTSSGAPAGDLDGNPRPVGNAVDVGAYEAQLLDCGDGTIDPGEQCGEPGLTCFDPCTICSQCICTLDEPVCGDGWVCATEKCELDADCPASQSCGECICVNLPVCSSGIGVDEPSLELRADAFRLIAKGRALVAKPWTAIDPPTNGVRLVVDHLSDPTSFDLTVPGGSAWKASAAGTKWRYKDPSGAVAGVTQAVVRDLSHKQDGLIRWIVRATGGTAALPPLDAIRMMVVLGDVSECAASSFQGPGGVRPRCKGDAGRIVCK